MPKKTTSHLRFLFLPTLVCAMSTIIAQHAFAANGNIMMINPLSQGVCSVQSLSSETKIDVDNEIKQIVQILDDAYQNALAHDALDADLEAEDSLLASASICFASRVLYEITEGSCRPDDRAETGHETAPECILDSRQDGLRNLSTMLSYAASRLENLGRSAPTQDGTTTSRSVFQIARIRSMEHLYRLDFALMQAHLDREQRRMYLAAADAMVLSACMSLKIERDLCECNLERYTASLGELSKLSQKLNEIGAHGTERTPTDNS